MALARESTTKSPGFKVGDIKFATYDITFTANALVEPANDPGFFLLNGSVISQTTYPLLFARYGTTFNTGGEGAGNFRLPDHTDGKFPITRGITNFPTYGAGGGEVNHLLTLTEFPSHSHGNTLGVSGGSHSHGASAGTSTDGDHNHLYTLINLDNATNAGASSHLSSTGGGSTSFAGNHSHNFNGFSTDSQTESFSKSGGVSNAGSGGSHNNMQPYLVIGGILVKHD